MFTTQNNYELQTGSMYLSDDPETSHEIFYPFFSHFLIPWHRQARLLSAFFTHFFYSPTFVTHPSRQHSRVLWTGSVTYVGLHKVAVPRIVRVHHTADLLPPHHPQTTSFKTVAHKTIDSCAQKTLTVV